jgi:Anti-sigma factor NepR
LPDQNKKNQVSSDESDLENPMKNPDEVQERLGFGLRSMYRSVLDEPLPADMMALLDQLDENEESNDKGSDSDSNSNE